MAFSFATITDGVATQLQGLEASMQAKLDIDPQNMTASDLFQLQVDVSQWSLANTTYSTVVKTLGDTLKGTLQKIG